MTVISIRELLETLRRRECLTRREWHIIHIEERAEEFLLKYRKAGVGKR